MKLTHTIFTAILCLTSTLGFAQTSKKTIPYRFATQAEAQMLITDIDDYTNGWNQFDINARLGKTDGRKSQLLSLAMSSTLSWGDADKAKVNKAFKDIEAAIKKQKLDISFPNEIILVKSTMEEECGIESYTRKNWIAIGENMLKAGAEAQLKTAIAKELFHQLTRNDMNFKKAAYATIGFEVTGHEILFPSDLMEKRISDPDVTRYDSYITLPVNGKDEKCTMVKYTSRPYSGGEIYDYIEIGLVPLNEQLVPIQENGNTIIYPIEEVKSLYDKIGANTNDIENPETVLASNFALILSGRTDIPNPEITGKLKSVLQQKF